MIGRLIHIWSRTAAQRHSVIFREEFSLSSKPRISRRSLLRPDRAMSTYSLYSWATRQIRYTLWMARPRENFLSFSKWMRQSEVKPRIHVKRTSRTRAGSLSMEHAYPLDYNSSKLYGLAHLVYRFIILFVIRNLYWQHNKSVSTTIYTLYTTVRTTVVVESGMRTFCFVDSHPCCLWYEFDPLFFIIVYILISQRRSCCSLAFTHFHHCI